MKTILIFFALIVICVNLHAQTNNPWLFEDYHFPPEGGEKSASIEYAPNGIAFTPKGDLRVLIVCAGFGSPYDGFDCGNWGTGSTSLPVWAVDKSTFYSQNSDFTTYSYLNNNENISRFYNEMSLGALRLTADIYPTRININPAGSSDWGSLTRKVFEKMKTDNPNFDWSVYDDRENYPNYTFDNSSTQPDNIPDFVVVLFRYNSGWTTQPVSGMQNWSGSAGGYAALDGLSGFVYNGYTFHSTGGYTHCSGISSMYGLFIHELAHSIFDCSHYAHANSVVGNYFYGQIGWGMMNLGMGSFGSALGWERWYLDWIGLQSNGVNSNVTGQGDLPVNGEFILRDFITTGDVVRVKLPNGTGKNQYLWLENHKGSSIFDNRGWTNDGCSNPLPSSPRGLVAYIESIHDDKEHPFNFWDANYKTANGIKYIHAKGNYDYSFGSSSSPCNLWGNLIYDLTEVNENPISGQSRAEMIRYDLNNNNEIYINEGVNSISPKNEEHWVTKREGNMTYDFMGSAINFQVGQKLGMATNPSLINRPSYDLPTKQMSTYYLNGISVTVYSQAANGDIKVRIAYNDVTVSSNLRWTGDIVLPDITSNTNPDLNLASNYSLTINKSGTPNRHTKTALNDFINPTTFTCENGAFFKMQANSTVMLDENSTFKLKIGSTLEINDGAKFIVKNGSKLEVESGAAILIKGSGGIILKCTGSLCVNSGATLNLQDFSSCIHLIGSGALSSGCLTSLSGVITGNGSVQNHNNALTLNSLTLNSDTYYSGTTITSTNVTVQGTGTDVVYDVTSGVTINGSFDIPFGSTFEVKLSSTNCAD